MPEAELVSRVLQIIVIDLVLSGDNAVVIGMAAHPLPRRQRMYAIAIGGAAAIALRVGLTYVAALLLLVPALRAVGGVLLLWIGFKLLEQEEAAEGGGKVASTLLGAIGTILLADLIMSLDNVLGVAAASHGDLILLGFGLVVSMAILMVGGGVFAELIDRMWWLAYLGAAVIVWTAADMVQDDAMIAQWVALPDLARWTVDLLVTIGVLIIAHHVHRAPLRLTTRSERT
jgi:YjbE family integral membrane protein